MNEKEIVKADSALLDCRPWGGEKNNEVKTSLALCSRGKYGSKITWISSCERVISGLGRVIRPNWNAPAATVTMTAEISCGSETQTKEFVLKVLPDEPFVDPQYESDRSFFEKLDVSAAALADIAEYARMGEYQKAKSELLQFYRQKEWKKEPYQRFLPGMTKMMMSGVSTLQRCDRFYKGLGTIRSAQYEAYNIPLAAAGLENGVTITYDICSLYNETVGVQIVGIGYPDETMRPRLEICTKNGKRIIDCTENTTVGAGKSADIPLNTQSELYTRLFGGFWGDGTCHSLIKFRIDGLQDAVQSARLMFYAKKDMELQGDKEILVLLFPENTWQSQSAKWKDFKWQFANRNGLPEPDTWDLEDGFDFEYLFQRVRFMHFPWLLQEYRETGDEDIIYYLIKTMTDFIKAKGMPRTYSGDHPHIGNAWRDDQISQTLCGGWPRGLDAAQRLASFAAVFGEVVQSRFMTAETCSAILKYIGDSCHAVAFQSLTKPVTNLRQFEIIGLFQAAVVFQEFKEQPQWMKTVNETMEQMILSVTLEDGTYKETTGGYNTSVCQNFVWFKKYSMKNGNRLSEKFEERLKRFAFYNMMMQGPGGESLQYGDQGAGRAEGIQYPELIEWFRDDELTFLLTGGRQGREPLWTSYRFPVSGVAVLRSDWGKDASYLFIQARGGGSHGHQDDNHITLISGGRVLLTDAGIFTYSADDPFRKWGTSPFAHNTVCINGEEQAYEMGSGHCAECVLDRDCDVISQGTNRYKGFSYTRRIIFLKPDIFIITDEIIPEDTERFHDYKQPWHMLPTAEMSFDYESRCIRSNFPDGVNIIIRSLDKDVILRRETGWYDYGYQQLAENPFGYFERKEIRGKTIFHTMLKVIGRKETNKEE